MNISIKLFIFDLDMTLVNSYEVMKKTYFSVCKLINKKPSQKGFLLFVGRSVTENAEYFHRLNPTIPRRKIKQVAVHTFLKHSNSVKPYKPNIVKILKRRKIKTAIITNNAYEFVKKICKKFNIKPDIILADEQIKAKGKEWAIKQLIKRFKLKPEEIIYVGDHKNDITAARKAGVKVAIIKRKTTKLGNLKPDFLLNKLTDLTKILRKSLKEIPLTFPKNTHQRS